MMGRIALIEDHHDTADLIQTILTDEHDVEWFPMAAAFLESFETSPFDLILLDLSLPDTDGYTVYSAIRRRNSEIPVILVSAHAHPEAIRAAMQKGVCEYVTKPIKDLERFRETVRRNIGHCRF